MSSPRLDKENGWISLRNDFRFFRFYLETRVRGPNLAKRKAVWF